MDDKKYDPDKDFFRGLTIRDIVSIAELATAHDFDWKTLNKANLTFAVYKSKANPYNDFTAMQYALMNIPLSNNPPGKYSHGFEFKIFEDGYISYENGSDVKMRIYNPIECYKIIEQKMKVKKIKSKK
jgi:hypothetical protein